MVGVAYNSSVEVTVLLWNGFSVTIFVVLDLTGVPVTVIVCTTLLLG